MTKDRASHKILETNMQPPEGLWVLSEDTLDQHGEKVGICEKGKIYSQLELAKLKLPVPNSIILTTDIFTDNNQLKPEAMRFIQYWMDQYPGCQFQLRGDYRVTGSSVPLQELRNLPSIRGLKSTEIFSNLIAPKLWGERPAAKLVLLQVIPPDAINRNLFSSQTYYETHTQTCYIEIRHDIATTMARENQTPDERIELPVELLDTLKSHELTQQIEAGKLRNTASEIIIREQFLYTLRRFGRTRIKQMLKRNFPRLENLDFYALLKTESEFDTNELQLLIENLLSSDSQSFNSNLELLELELPQDYSDCSLGEFLTILGLLELTETKSYSWHTMKQRLQRIRRGEATYGYRHPTSDMYQQLIEHLQVLSNAGILQQGTIPKLSILDTQDLPAPYQKITFIYWDLIKTTINFSHSP